jgi:DHA3 family tetracycline resistance protein-like MFS transporter
MADVHRRVAARRCCGGLAYTFTSGATTAWLTGELGEPGRDELSSLFLRLSRLGSVATLVALPFAWLLAGWSLRTPLTRRRRLELLLTAWLVVAMGEERFRPVERADRSTWRHMVDIGRQGVGAMWSRRVLVWFAVFAVVVGGASEAYDRLYEAQLLGPVGLPTWFGWSPLVWFGLLTTASAALGIVVPPLVERRRPAASADEAHPLAARAHRRPGRRPPRLRPDGRLRRRSDRVPGGRAVAERPRHAAHVVPRAADPSSTRATVLSAFGQADAVGQVVIGPVFGLIGRLVSVPAALVASAVATVPGLPIIAAAGRDRAEAGEPMAGARA